MRALLKFLLMIVVLAAIGLGGAWWWAGRMSPPVIELRQPAKLVGQATSMELALQAPGGRFSQVEVTLSQNGVNHQIFTLEQQGDAKVTQQAADRLYVMRPIGRKAIPDLRSGKATITVRAARPVLYGLRQV